MSQGFLSKLRRLWNSFSSFVLVCLRHSGLKKLEKLSINKGVPQRLKSMFFEKFRVESSQREHGVKNHATIQTNFGLLHNYLKD